MITNRTFEDVIAAKKIREDKVKKFLPLTAKEVQTLEKGCLTPNSLNRIEEKEAELLSLIRDMGYFGGEFESKQWNEHGVFKADDLNRIFANCEKLRQSFFALKTSPMNLFAIYDYRQFNNLEKVLVDIESQIVYTKSNYKRCGLFVAKGD